MDATYSESLRALAEPSPAGDRIKVAIGRAARAAGLGYWRAFDIWYGKARRIDVGEADRIAAALQSKREMETANELQDLRSRLIKMESRLAAEGKDVGRTPAYSVRKPLR